MKPVGLVVCIMLLAAGFLATPATARNLKGLDKKEKLLDIFGKKKIIMVPSPPPSPPPPSPPPPAKEDKKELLLDLLKKKLEVAAPFELPETPEEVPKEAVPSVPGATAAAVSGVGK